MSIYTNKLAHVQVAINCQYSVVQMCTGEDTLAHILGAPYFDDVIFLAILLKERVCWALLFLEFGPQFLMSKIWLFLVLNFYTCGG